MKVLGIKQVISQTLGLFYAQISSFLEYSEDVLCNRIGNTFRHCSVKTGPE